MFKFSKSSFLSLSLAEGHVEDTATGRAVKTTILRSKKRLFHFTWGPRPQVSMEIGSDPEGETLRSSSTSFGFR